MIQQGVQFVIKLKDLMRGEWPTTARHAQSAFNKIDASSKKTKRGIDITHRSVNTLDRAIRMLERRRNISVDSSDIDAANRKITILKNRLRELKTTGTDMVPMGKGGRNIGGGIGRGLSYLRMAGMAATFGGVMLGATTARSAANMGLQGGAQKMSFQTIAGDQEGAKLYRDVTKFAQDSIFGNELYKNAQTQLAFGANAKEVMPTLRMLGDVSMGDKGRLESLNLAYSQVRSAGKLMGQDLLQFVNAGFNPLQEMSAKTGKSMAQLRKEMGDGKITFDQVKGSFVSATSAGGKFYKMTDRIADTPYGKVENLRGQIDGVLLQAGEMLAPAIGKAIDRYASPMVDFLGKEVVPRIGDMMEWGSQFVGPFKEFVGTTGQLLRPIANFAMSDEVADLTKGLMSLSTSLGKQLAPVLEDLVVVLKPFVGTAAGIVKWMGSGMSNREKKEMAKREMAARDSLLDSAPAKFDYINRSLNPVNMSKPVPGIKTSPGLQNVWDTFAQRQDPALFGSQNLTKKPKTEPTIGDVLTGSGNAGGTGGGTSTSTDVITGGGSKTLNVNVNASPFHIEQMSVDASGPSLRGNDIERTKRLFEQWFYDLMRSAGFYE